MLRGNRLRHYFNVIAFIASISISHRLDAQAIYSWGDDSSGQLGNGTVTTTPFPIPSAISGLADGVTAVVGGQTYGMAIRSGGVVAWGGNSSGQLGTGNSIDSALPTALGGQVASGVTSVAAGAFHSLAIRNGGVYAWGANGDGNLGTGDQFARKSPVALTGNVSSNVTAVAAGEFHSLAICNGGVYAWGSNGAGALGTGIRASSTVPVALTGALSSGVTAIACGYSVSMAIKDGGLYTWGNGGNSQLGDGTTINSLTPNALTGVLSSNVTGIAFGRSHSLALCNGNVYAWGLNESGQLGNGTTVRNNSPILVDPAELNNISAVAASDGSSYALAFDGSLWVWGDNTFGELGIGSTNPLRFYTPHHLLPPTGYLYSSTETSAFGDYTFATLKPVPEPGSFALSFISCAFIAGRCRLRRGHSSKRLLAGVDALTASADRRTEMGFPPSYSPRPPSI